MVLVVGIFQAAYTLSSHRKRNAFGVCGGYDQKLLDEILVGVIRAVYKYLDAYQPVTILGNISAVDPKLESTAPIDVQKCHISPQVPKKPRLLLQPHGYITQESYPQVRQRRSWLELIMR